MFEGDIYEKPVTPKVWLLISLAHSQTCECLTFRPAEGGGLDVMNQTTHAQKERPKNVSTLPFSDPASNIATDLGWAI